jgi:hypothetical protein
MKRIWDENIHVETEDRDEILLVVDPESNYYATVTDRNGEADTGNELHPLRIRNLLNLAGAPYQSCCMDDLFELKTLDAYKVIVFANLFCVTDARLALLRERILRNGRTVLWLHAPGIIRNGVYAPEHVEALCGIPSGTTGLHAKRFSDWTSLYLSAPEHLGPEALRGLLDEAGVHACVPVGTGVQANSRFLMVHSETPQGHLPIRLPDRAATVTELFSNRVAARNTSEWDERFEFPDTRLFFLDWS